MYVERLHKEQVRVFMLLKCQFKGMGVVPVLETLIF